MANKKTNPYDWTNPVLDPKLFAGREAELEGIKGEISKLASENPIVPMIGLLGERRVGKTSMLFRISEMCEKMLLLPVEVCVDDMMAKDPWEFWQEVFSNLLICAGK